MSPRSMGYVSERVARAVDFLRALSGPRQQQCLAGLRFEAAPRLDPKKECYSPGDRGHHIGNTVNAAECRFDDSGGTTR